MTTPQEYHYVAKGSECEGSNCYCFQQKNQFNDVFEDSDCDSDTDTDTVSVPVTSSWTHSDSDDWIVCLNDLTFRHPRVLLAYFRFVSVTNELALTTAEQIRVPRMPLTVRDYILKHVSFQEIPEEFADELMYLKAWIHLVSEESTQGISLPSF